MERTGLGATYCTVLVRGFDGGDGRSGTVTTGTVTTVTVTVTAWRSRACISSAAVGAGGAAHKTSGSCGSRVNAYVGFADLGMDSIDGPAIAVMRVLVHRRTGPGVT